MSTESEDIINRYRETFAITDSRGRTLRMRRLKLSQQAKIIELTDKPINRVNFNIAASVFNIDDFAPGFPADLDEMHAMLDRLGEEGFKAAADKYVEINGLKKDVETGKDDENS